MPERYLGTTLGKYRVDTLVGSGGFAWVYKAFDPELEIPVALKVLKPQFGGDADFVARFKREAAVAAKLRHPNIIKIYTIGREGDAVYFAMDYLPSGLADKLEAMPYLHEDAVVQIGMDVARALGFAHREGVIHRDIKVDNIMFDEHGNAVVADFGIARALSGYTGQTGTGMVVGTPQYFAPEQARAKPLDGRADIYSLGVTLYRASTGRLPFVGDDWYEVARQHVEDTPAPPRSLNPTLSEEFETVLLRCLAKRPDDRPTTGEQLLDELELVRTGGRILTPAKARTVAVPSLGDTAIVPAAGIATPPGADVTAAPPSATIETRREQRTVWLTAAVLLVLVIAAVPLLARRLPNAASGAAPDSIRQMPGMVVTSPASPLMDSVPVDTLSDSVRKIGSRSRDTSGRLMPLGARLTINAPAEASVTVNGVSVGTGRWQSDTLRSGDYEVVASVRSIAGCEWASVTRTVRVRPGAAKDETFNPRACGSLAIDLKGRQGRYVVTAPEGQIRKTGQVPPQNPVVLVLPVGRYTLTVNKTDGTDFCTAYTEDDLEITAEGTQRRSIPLICQSPGF